MDMSELGNKPIASEAGHPMPAGGSLADQERWHVLVAEMGAEIAAPLTAALERINTLTSTGRIDKQGLRS